MSGTDVYPCKYFKAAVTATPCDGLGQGECLGTGSCAWCQSAAVGNACYTAVRLGYTLHSNLPAARCHLLLTLLLHCSSVASSASRTRLSQLDMAALLDP